MHRAYCMHIFVVSSTWVQDDTVRRVFMPFEGISCLSLEVLMDSLLNLLSSVGRTGPSGLRAFWSCRFSIVNSGSSDFSGNRLLQKRYSLVMSGIYRHKGSRKQAQRQQYKISCCRWWSCPCRSAMGPDSWRLTGSLGFPPPCVDDYIESWSQWDDLRCIPSNAQGEILDEWIQNISPPFSPHCITAALRAKTGPAASIRCRVAWLGVYNFPKSRFEFWSFYAPSIVCLTAFGSETFPLVTPPEHPQSVLILAFGCID